MKTSTGRGQADRFGPSLLLGAVVGLMVVTGLLAGCSSNSHAAAGSSNGLDKGNTTDSTAAPSSTTSTTIAPATTTTLPPSASTVAPPTTTGSAHTSSGGLCTATLVADFAATYPASTRSAATCQDQTIDGSPTVTLSFGGDPNRYQANSAQVSISADMQNGASFFATEQQSANESGALQVTGPVVNGRPTLWFPPGHLLALDGSNDITVDLLPVGSAAGSPPADAEQRDAQLLTDIEAVTP